jgi:hypothetical protein
MVSKLQAWRRLGGAVLVWCLAAAASRGQFTVVKGLFRGPDAVSLTVDRFEELKDSLPASGVICYLSDIDPSQRNGQRLWYLAEYSLAPLVLRTGIDCEQVVGMFSDRATAADLIRSSGLEIERRYDANLVLLRRKRP